MCLAALAWGVSPRFPLVIAANRDEFYLRPADPLGWWPVQEGAARVLAGRDVQAGGTWMGVNDAGRFGLLTNVRRPDPVPEAAPSRGHIVPQWLESGRSARALTASADWQAYAPFNLLGGDLRQGELFWLSNSSGAPLLQPVGPGVHGLSNAALDTPWPKLLALKAQLSWALKSAGSVRDLADRLLTSLADGTAAPDDQLPQTGVSLEIERMLSPIFIHSEARGYGTRCSTVLIVETDGPGASLTLIERSHRPDGAERCFTLPWPAVRLQA